MLLDSKNQGYEFNLAVALGRTRPSLNMSTVANRKQLCANAYLARI